MSIIENENVILVTGGTGLVGNAIQWILEHEGSRKNERWIFTSIEEYDLISMDNAKALFAKYKPTHVIHLAAKLGGYSLNLQANLAFLRENILINDNVLQAAYQSGARKVVSCLTSCIFPDKVKYPVNETMIYDGAPHDSLYGYSYAKRLVAIMNRGYNEYPGVLYTSFIPCNIFGPHDNYNIEEGHVIPGLIHKAHLAKNEGKPLVIWGNGKALRQYIYSRDLARLIIWTLREYKEKEPIILTPGEEDEISIKETAEKIAQAMEFKNGFKLDLTKSNGQYRKTADNSKLRGYLPHFKFTPIDKALKETCDWFLENYDVLRK